MHASVCSLIFFSQGRDTAALWRQGWTGKTSGFFGCGRRTDARLGHGVVAIYPGTYWIINTFGGTVCLVIRKQRVKKE
ncbi:hypothetical protein [Aneurinibacillus migulanus]|uniref:hypothetical protein n=1 Tax=Aneurinibacillus migulanus TaxID=47500 RepID=UPI000AB54FB6|nr:hypothetical protein [Aneurinibacillus migulanus]